MFYLKNFYNKSLFNIRSGKIKKELIHLFAVLTILLTVIPNCFAEYSQKRHVLVLSSYHKGLSWTDNTIKGVESVITEQDFDIELHYEFMDTKRYLDDQYFQRLYELYKFKYNKDSFALIIATDNDALNFLLKYKKMLFPATPVVFCGVNNFRDSMLEGHDLYSGIVEETDMKSTLDIALKLHPRIKQIFVINDRTTTGIALKEQLTEIIPYYSNRASFVFYDDFDINELRTEVKKLTDQTLIFLLIVNQDKTGRFFTYEESLAIIRENSNVPIYSIWDFYIGKGIVGGMLTSGYNQGKTAAQIASRILQGENIRNIPIIKKSPNIFMFDFKEIERFNLDIINLPKDSTVINQPVTLYSKHKKVILTSLAIIVSLSLIIVTLALNIVKRKKTEKLLRQSEEKYKDLYDNAPDMYHSIDKDGFVIECNETEARLLGYEKHEIIDRPITDFLTERSKIDHEREFPTLKNRGKEAILEREFVRKDGTTFLASLHVFIETDSRGELVRTKTIARDITRQKQTEDELKRSREELRNLSLHLQSAREEERRNIAREIHDELGHSLTALKLDLSWLRNRLTKEDNNLFMKAQDMMHLVDSTVESIQKISSQLRPGVLDYLGLTDTIEWQLNEIQRKSDILCTLNIKGDFENISLQQERSTATFRVFQEAVTNILRHADATKINVDLHIIDRALRLAIIDNGKGISEKQIYDPMSFGILGMRERACFLEGDIKIMRDNEKGTYVELIVPLKDSEIKINGKSNNS